MIIVAPLLFILVLWVLTCLSATGLSVYRILKGKGQEGEKEETSTSSKSGFESYERTKKKTCYSKSNQSVSQGYAQRPTRKPYKNNKTSSPKNYKGSTNKPTQSNSKTYKAQNPKAKSQTKPRVEEERIVASPVYDGVTIEELRSQMTPDNADIVSAEGLEDVIEAALERDALKEQLGVS
jgi:hypothetical protein